MAKIPPLPFRDHMKPCATPLSLHGSQRIKYRAGWEKRMDLAYNQDAERFRAELRDFIAANWPLPDEVGSAVERTAEFHRRAIARGFMFRHIPEAFGGSEQPVDFVKNEIIKEEFARTDAPREPQTVGLQRVVPLLLHWGTEAQKQRFIPPTVRSEIYWAQGYSEPNAGSDLAAVSTRAELVGDRWIINGQKVWSSNAYKSDFMHALVRTDSEPRHKGLSYFLIDLRQPGVEIRRIRQITGESEFCEVFFTDAVAPLDALVGGRGNGWLVSKTTLHHERAGFRSVQWLESLLRRLVRLAKRAERNGLPSIEDARVRSDLARVEARLQAMRYSAYRAFSMEIACEEPGPYLLTQKLYLTDTVQMIERLARDLIGEDYLLVRPGDAEQGGHRDSLKWIELALHSLKIAIAGGSSNIQRNIIAERGLGLPKDFTFTGM